MDKCIFAYLTVGSYDQTTLKKVVNKPTDKLALLKLRAKKVTCVRSLIIMSAILLIFADPSYQILSVLNSIHSIASS